MGAMVQHRSVGKNMFPKADLMVVMAETAGNVYLISNPHLSTLLSFRFKKDFKAQSGQHGMGKKKTGKRGFDLVLEIPVGTQVTVRDKGDPKNFFVMDFSFPGQKERVAKGGKGGLGNVHFKSSTHQTPYEHEEGGLGEEKELTMELKLLADVGLVGLPNAGKSSLLTVISAARPKVASYPFTTIEPSLGVTEKGIVVADIPGLIEGASSGKGLGHTFLRHIERTRCLVHMLALDLSNVIPPSFEDLWNAYQKIRNELRLYNPTLTRKPEIIVLNKIDLIEKGSVETFIKAFSKKRKRVIPISCATHKGLDELQQAIQKCVKKV